MRVYDFIIFGAGGTGLAAAMYSARLGLKTLVLGASNNSELSIGGAITTTNIVENYPGFIKITGEELAKKIEEHARSYNSVEIREEKAVEIKRHESYFEVKTEESEYQSKTVLFATGTKLRKLNIPGNKKYENKGIHYCAICDGAVFRDKIVAVIGDSDTAAKDALLLAEYSKKVYIISREKNIRPEQIHLDRIKKNKKIEILYSTNVIGIKGDKVVNKVVLDKKYNGNNELKLDGVFIAIGRIPISDLAKKIGVRLNKWGEIMIDHKTSSTNIKGIFAAGDVTDKKFKQLITGVADGCTAAYSAYEHIKKLGGKQNGRT